MTKKKTRKIVTPAIVLIVAICLIVIFSNFTQVRGFMSGITSATPASSDSLAAVKVPKPSVSITSVDNLIIGATVLHPGDPISVSWVSQNISGDLYADEKIDVQVSADGKLQAVGNALQQVTCALSPLAGRVISGAVGAVVKKTPNFGDCELNAKDGPGQHAWELGLLSQLPGKVNTSVVGRISKKVYVTASLYHLTTDKNGAIKNQIDASDKSGDRLIADTLSMDLPKVYVPSLGFRTEARVIHPGDELFISWKETGTFGIETESGIKKDFADTMGISIGSLSAKSFPFTLTGKRDGFDTTWTVPDFVQFPGAADTSIPGKVRKNVVIKGTLAYVGEGATEDKAPKLTAVSQTFQIEDDAPVVSLKSDKTTVSSGLPVVLTWNSSGMVSCTAPWFSAGQKKGTAVTTAGTVAVNPVQTTTYTVVCTGIDSKKHNGVVVVAVEAPHIVATVYTGLNGTNTGDFCYMAPVGWTTGNYGCYSMDIYSDGHRERSKANTKKCSAPGTISNCPAKSVKIIDDNYTINSFNTNNSPHQSIPVSGLGIHNFDASWSNMWGIYPELKSI